MEGGGLWGTKELRWPRPGLLASPPSLGSRLQAQGLNRLLLSQLASPDV